MRKPWAGTLRPSSARAACASSTQACRRTSSPAANSTSAACWRFSAARIRALGARRLVIDAADLLLRLFRDPRREEDQLIALHQLADRAAADRDHHGQDLDRADRADAPSRIPDRLRAAARPSRARAGVDAPPARPEIPRLVVLQQRIPVRDRCARARAHARLEHGTDPRVHSARGSPTGVYGLDAIGGRRLVPWLERADRWLQRNRQDHTGLFDAAAAAAPVASECSTSVSRKARRAWQAPCAVPASTSTSALQAGSLRFLTSMPEAMGVEEHLWRIFEVVDLRSATRDR